jgi:serine/threonine protein kinase
VLPLCAHVAAALHYMAEMDMLHLDVKPDNIIMGVPPRLIRPGGRAAGGPRQVAERRR